MNQSENINELAKALCNVQKESLFALTDTLNPFFKKKYADLSSVWDVIRKPLTDNGLAITQTMNYTGDRYPIIITTLMHESGQWKESRLLIKPDKDTPQGLGSAITYGRRYSLAAMVGVCPADDDAEGAMDRGKAKTKADKKIKKEIKDGKMTGAEWTRIENLGLDVNKSLVRNDVIKAVKAYGEAENIDPKSGDMATRCLDKPGIAQIVNAYIESQTREPGEEG